MLAFLEHVTDDVLSPEEKKRWQEEYDELYDATVKWARQTSERFTPEELHYLTILHNPKFWAAETLKWYCRDYQEPMLQEMAESNRTVLRLGRRLGKTETMCIIILWHAFTQPNKGPNNQYNILIIAPFESQVDLIFDRLHQLIDMSSDIQPSRDIHHRIELPNGTIITGMTAGSKSGSGAANTRGQRADLIVLDEVDYMGSPQITNIMNIRNEAPERIKIIAASTPAGKREEYYKWCTGATKTYEYDEEATKKNGRVTYKVIWKPYKTNPDGSYQFNHLGHRMREGNGWTTIYSPSTVNPELLKINPETGLTYLEELRQDLTEMRFIQEVLAEFGESMSGVFLKKHIDAAIELGRKENVTYITKRKDLLRQGPKILGVDWDKSAADTNMIGMVFDKDKNIFVPFFRKTIPRGDFTYHHAVEEIKKAQIEFDFNYIIVDAGHGEAQIEQLRLWAENRRKNMGKCIIRVNLSEKISVFDPVTKKVEKKHIKPFMVENAVLMFERGVVALHPDDKETIEQFESYEIKSWGVDGRPVYTKENEHILDCFVFCLYGFTKYYDDILKVTKSARVRAIYEPLDRVNDDIKDRSIPKETVEESQQRRLAASLGFGIQPARHRTRRGYERVRRSVGMPTRKMF